MKNTEFHPADYDGHGHLCLPFLFWCVLLLQARTWVLFVIAGSSYEQGNALLNLFYPDHDTSWLRLLPGVPAVLAFSLNGRRFASPVIQHWLCGLLILVRLVPLCWQPVMWLAGNPLDGVRLTLLIADIITLIWLSANQRLHIYFSLERKQRHFSGKPDSKQC